MKRWIIISAIALGSAALAAAETLTLTVHTDKVTKTVGTGIYGQFLEHIFNSVHGGLWGDQILNGTLELTPPRPARGPTPRPGAGRGPAPTSGPGITWPRNWDFVGAEGELAMDKDNPLNAEYSVKITPKAGGSAVAAAGLLQENIALKAGEKYTLTLYARGTGSVITSFLDGYATLYSKTFTGLTAEWQKLSVVFTVPRAAGAATLKIGAAPLSAVNVDQVSLFSAGALAVGGYRPDLLKAVADLKPDSIRWPGGSFASRYVWQNGVGPREKRLPHPSEQWNDRDTYQFGTDEFMQLCERIGAEPIPVINTNRGVQDALNWLEYILGGASTEFGKQRIANGRKEPYNLRTVEIDNETWRMQTAGYLNVVNQFCPAIRARWPKLRLSVVGSYGYDTGIGQANQTDWDPTLIQKAGKTFDIISPHYYNGIYSTADYVEDPRKYEQFLKGRGEIIRTSGNPGIKIYVSEWNLTNKAWGNDWRMGLYAGGLLNGFERQADIVKMSCPALFLRRSGVTQDWDNALVNFDQTTWYPGSTYVVMKLWRDSFAPNLLAVDGPDHPLNFVATRSADKKTVYLKAVNPTNAPVDAEIRLDGRLKPKTASLQLIAPGGEAVKNSLEQRDAIKPGPAKAAVEKGVIKFTMPPLSAGVVKVN